MWACSSKEVRFVVLLVQLGSAGFSVVRRLSRISKNRVGISARVSVRVSLVLMIWWGQDFPTWREWSYMPGSGRLSTTLNVIFTLCLYTHIYTYILIYIAPKS